MHDDALLRRLADRLEIADLLARYCRAIDTLDWDLLDRVFIDDASIDYSSSGGTTGRYPEVRTWLAGVLPAFAMRQHLVTNLEVELDGDRATSRCCLYNPMGRARSDGPVQLFFVGGTYEDELVRTPSGWRIARRTERQSWVDLRD
ncbi:MAG: hypothetical protein RL698_1210 [Pseudomonadota bacterium]|jgi:3-phenylpropionate/cinnamic acid dioxygenase small subunit